MKDFRSSGSNSNLTIDEVAAAVFKGDIDKKLPPRITICSSIFADLDAGQVTSYDSMRGYPTWGFLDQDRRVNLSLGLSHQVWSKTGVDKFSLNMGTSHPNKYLGMLSLVKKLTTPSKKLGHSSKASRIIFTNVL